MPLMVAAKPRSTIAKDGAKPKGKASKRVKKERSVLDIDAKLRLLGPYPMATGPCDDLDYDALTRRRLDWTAARSKLLAQKHEASRITDIDAIKAKNAPTVEVSIDDPEAKKRARKNLTRVRQSEAWRYKQLSPMQRQAEIEMETAWKARTTGLDAAVSRYGSYATGTPSVHEMGAAIDRTWRDWINEARLRGVVVNVVIECFSQPKTLPDIEHEYRLRPGAALSHYQRGLDIWCELRGWMRRVEIPLVNAS